MDAYNETVIGLLDACEAGEDVEHTCSASLKLLVDGFNAGNVSMSSLLQLPPMATALSPSQHQPQEEGRMGEERRRRAATSLIAVLLSRKCVLETLSQAVAEQIVLFMSSRISSDATVSATHAIRALQSLLQSNIIHTGSAVHHRALNAVLQCVEVRSMSQSVRYCAFQLLLQYFTHLKHQQQQQREQKLQPSMEDKSVLLRDGFAVCELLRGERDARCLVLSLQTITAAAQTIHILHIDNDTLSSSSDGDEGGEDSLRLLESFFGLVCVRWWRSITNWEIDTH